MFKKYSNKAQPIWPKHVPELTDEQKSINDDWQKYFHKVNKDQFSNIVSWGHEYVIRNSEPKFLKTLEVGPGLGEHLRYENLSQDQKNNYVGIELRNNMANMLKNDYPFVKLLIGDCQEYIDYPTKYFDRIIAIHLLEHLPNLPLFLKEANRLLSDDGILEIVIPCEGGFGYSLGRALTTKRMFEKRYKMPYNEFIRYEHVNTAREIVKELQNLFVIKNNEFYPSKIHLIDANLIIGLTLAKK